MLVFAVLAMLSLLSLSTAQPPFALVQGPSQQFVVNSGFETGQLAPWQVALPASVPTGTAQFGVQAQSTANNVQCHSGNFCFVYGIRNPDTTFSSVNVTQQISVPSFAGEVFFLQYWAIAQQNFGQGVYFTLTAYFNGQPIAITNSNIVSPTLAVSNNGYTLFQGNITEPAGTKSSAGTLATITLVFASYNTVQKAYLDDVTLTAPSILGITGDPQFIGLRGQSYQVHGMDGEVYNLITDRSLQVNSRFVFLSEGKCPIIDGKAAKNCWSHPGSYLGAIGVQQVVDGKVEQLAITSGSSTTGFASILLNGEAMKVGDSYTNGVFSVQYTSKYEIDVVTEQFSLRFDNSDMFINQQVKANVPLSTLTSHGLFGQTHQRKLHNNALRYIEGEVDDYVVASQDLFGADCAFNKFAPLQ